MCTPSKLNTIIMYLYPVILPCGGKFWGANFRVKSEKAFSINIRRFRFVTATQSKAWRCANK